MARRIGLRPTDGEVPISASNTRPSSTNGAVSAVIAAGLRRSSAASSVREIRPLLWIALMTALWLRERIRSRPRALEDGRLIGLPINSFRVRSIRGGRSDCQALCAGKASKHAVIVVVPRCLDWRVVLHPGHGEGAGRPVAQVKEG